MEKLEVIGVKKLKGTVKISGSKKEIFGLDNTKAVTPLILLKITQNLVCSIVIQYKNK